MSSSAALQGDACPLFPHTWTADDKFPGLILIFDDLTLIASGLTIKACLQRPTTLLNKTLVNLDEQRASLIWDAGDLVAGIGQLLTVFSENVSNERTHLAQLLLDVREKVCA